MTDIQFGTDGWRGVIAEQFTFANVARVAQAAAGHWAAHKPAGTEPRVVVSYDRRFLSAEFAQLTAEVFAGNGFEVILTPEPTPTPCVSFAVKRLRAAGGVVITASHNPPRFNGFKLKAHYGGSADPAECQAVEAQLDRTPVRRLALETAVRQRRVLCRDVRPAAFCRDPAAGGFPARREGPVAGGARRAVRRRRRLLRGVAGRNDLPRDHV
jgi:phosphomannomutase